MFLHLSLLVAYIGVSEFCQAWLGSNQQLCNWLMRPSNANTQAPRSLATIYTSDHFYVKWLIIACNGRVSFTACTDLTVLISVYLILLFLGTSCIAVCVTTQWSGQCRHLMELPIDPGNHAQRTSPKTGQKLTAFATEPVVQSTEIPEQKFNYDIIILLSSMLLFHYTCRKFSIVNISSKKSQSSNIDTFIRKCLPNRNPNSVSDWNYSLQSFRAHSGRVIGHDLASAADS